MESDGAFSLWVFRRFIELICSSMNGIFRVAFAEFCLLLKYTCNIYIYFFNVGSFINCLIWTNIIKPLDSPRLSGGSTMWFTGISVEGILKSHRFWFLQHRFIIGRHVTHTVYSSALLELDEFPIFYIMVIFKTYDNISFL